LWYNSLTIETDFRFKHDNELKPRTPEEILRATASEFSALEKQADNALYRDRDTATYKLKLRDRTRLLLFLPLKLQQAIERGESFPENAMDKINDFAANATDMLASGNMFGLDALLTHQGSKIGDPNDLEKLINKLYSPKQPSTGSEPHPHTQ
jgi:hypothetical protein